ncbi:MAG TPA: hypothetical protein VGU71_08115 [Candidatus Dormibacteraeota bacterium]|nr:hypothetical protein [Candidatus Dormibacteraeota bacterium]
MRTFFSRRLYGSVLLGLVIMLAAVGCQPTGLTAKEKPVTAQSIAPQPGDASGLQRCGESGDIQAVLRDEKSNNPMAYELNAPEWEHWRSLGASDAYFAVYGRFASDCDALSGSGTGAPSGGLMAALIVKFKSEAIAARIYGTNSTLLGFGPRDIAFIKEVGGSVTTGSDTGLGPRSVIGSGSVAGSTYYFAFWQNKAFESFLVAYDIASAEARGAANNVNQRIR